MGEKNRRRGEVREGECSKLEGPFVRLISHCHEHL